MDFTIPFVTRNRFTNTEGVNESWRFQLKPGIGKDNTTYPYVIVNEWVAANIAQFLQLPVAPFGLFKKKNRRTLMFGSVNFEGDTRPKNVIPATCWSRHPDTCTGIVVFDMLVGNSDRHRGNIKVDDANNPNTIYLFDHDRTLLHIKKGDGIARLRSIADRLGISAGSVSGGNRHCLIDVMDTSAFFPHWLDRVYEIPRTFVENVCSRVEGMGATKAELSEIVAFVEMRRRQLPDIMKNHRNAFPNITDWPLVP